MEIFLIRHTKVNLDKGICYGHKDVSLAESYPEELEIVKEKLPKCNYDIVYSSPLKRCRQLAEDLFPENIKFDDRLKDLNFGDWEGKEWDEISDPAFKLWMNDFVNRKCTNGESFAMLRDRVSEFWSELSALECCRVAIITHSGVISTIQAIEKNIKLEEAFNESPVDFGDIIKLNI